MPRHLPPAYHRPLPACLRAYTVLPVLPAHGLQELDEAVLPGFSGGAQTLWCGNATSDHLIQVGAGGGGRRGADGWGGGHSRAAAFASMHPIDSCMHACGVASWVSPGMQRSVPIQRGVGGGAAADCGGDVVWRWRWR